MHSGSPALESDADAWRGPNVMTRGCVRPSNPRIFASTVDQVGSRLLFRGYGVSEGMRPVHAGILGTDTLYLLDEVHLATAFEQTLTDLAMYAEPKWREHGGSVGRPISVLRMSATPRRSESKDRTTFGLSDDDRLHPVLRKRLEANRPARLELVKTKASKGSNGSNRELLANVACTRALQAADAGARTIGIVMNRVAHAVAVADLLERKESGAVLLLTGRMRPFDRAGVQAALTTVATAGATDDSAEKPTFVVATSCIEAGADYDFDALVTEVASLPALRQRFGRLNRLGERAQSSAWILGSKHALSASAKPEPDLRRSTRKDLGVSPGRGRRGGGRLRPGVGSPTSLPTSSTRCESRTCRRPSCSRTIAISGPRRARPHIPTPTSRCGSMARTREESNRISP